MAVVALSFRLYEKPFLGWDSTKLDTIAAIFLPITALLFWLSGRLKPKSPTVSAPAAISETREQRLRRELLARFKTTWGVGETSDHTIEGDGGKVSPASVEKYPRNMTLVTRNSARTPLPPETAVIDVFERVRNRLIILGRPGAGKTTALLELSASAVARAEEDPLYPIPFIFHLASWSRRWDSFEDWLIAELAKQPYSLPEKYARSLIDGEHLLLLLDGLDEVPDSNREACVKVLDQFRQDHELTYMAICSRTEQYTRLKSRIQAGKVMLLPLTQSQIKEHLAGRGNAFAGLLEAISKDEELSELAQSPLMLNLLVQTYREVPAERLFDQLRGQTPAQELLGAYVERMLELPRSGTRYTKKEVIRWLAWLAGSMKRELFPLFLVEWMQPSLLRGDLRVYVTTVILTSYLIAVWKLLQNVPLLARTLGYSHQRWWMILIAVVAAAVFGHACGVLAVVRGIQPVEKLTWSWERARLRVIRGFVLVFALAIIVWLGFEFDWLNYRITAMFFLLGFCGLLGGFLISKRLGKLMVARSVPAQPRLVSNAHWLPAIGLGLGLLIFIAIELIWSPHPKLPLHLASAAKAGLIWAGVLLPINLSLGGMGFRTSLPKHTPNQGIVQSWRSAAIAYLLTLFFIIGIFCVLEWEAGRWPPTVSGDLATNTTLQLFAGVTTLATFAALGFGGLAVIEHFALRFALYKRGVVPWRYVKFLNYAADRALLRKVGGGYLFVHRFLEDYFASLEPKAANAEDSESLANNLSQ